NKVPIQSNLFNHFIMPSFLISTYGRLVEAHEQQCHSDGYVKTVETSDKEEELGEGCGTILVYGHVCAIYRLGDKLIHRVDVGHQSAGVRTMDEVCPFPSLA